MSQVEVVGVRLVVDLSGLDTKRLVDVGEDREGEEEVEGNEMPGGTDGFLGNKEENCLET